ncbi:hypothetical protein SAMN06265222_12129 [Neorhodopirellula lusitana]|uniref:Uncharacterized protein n=1 Tax=Neorhodopirellula lusitana TaxID=445327 RepID=A0ABY1QSG0_9BACT|nr:hypothetical protein SAMN06265222_12129 [Neorhodopirellula lusitana]
MSLTVATVVLVARVKSPLRHGASALRSQYKLRSPNENGRTEYLFVESGVTEKIQQSCRATAFVSTTVVSKYQSDATAFLGGEREEF